jgi:hypothetical protein
MGTKPTKIIGFFNKNKNRGKHNFKYRSWNNNKNTIYANKNLIRFYCKIKKKLWQENVPKTNVE